MIWSDSPRRAVACPVGVMELPRYSSRGLVAKHLSGGGHDEVSGGRAVRKD